MICINIVHLGERMACILTHDLRHDMWFDNIPWQFLWRILMYYWIDRHMYLDIMFLTCSVNMFDNSDVILALFLVHCPGCIQPIWQIFWQKIFQEFRQELMTYNPTCMLYVLSNISCGICSTRILIFFGMCYLTISDNISHVCYCISHRNSTEFSSGIHSDIMFDMGSDMCICDVFISSDCSH